MYDHERLMFFKRADIVSDFVHDISKSFPKFETYELGSQMRRAADSIVFNISEGGGKESVAEMVTYLRHALGSSKELKSQISKVSRRGYLDKKKCNELVEELNEIGKMINGFMKKLREKD